MWTTFLLSFNFVMKKVKQYLLSRFVLFLNYNNVSNKKWLTYDRGIVVECVLSVCIEQTAVSSRTSCNVIKWIRIKNANIQILRIFNQRVFPHKKDKLSHIIDKAAVLQPQKPKNRLIDFDLLYSEPLQIYL